MPPYFNIGGSSQDNRLSLAPQVEHLRHEEVWLEMGTGPPM
jgi:hypothetical protein